MKNQKRTSFKRIDWENGNNPGFRMAFWVLFSSIVMLLPTLSFHFGITWDEWTQQEYGEDILNYYLTAGKDQSVYDLSKHTRFAHLYYGASFDTLAALVQRYLSPFGIYETRHLLNSLFGAFTMLFTGLIARTLGNWRVALLALFLMVVSPRFFGHSMNNPKDIPFALGYAIAIYFLILWLKGLPNPNKWHFAGLIFGIALTISVKIGGLILLGYVGLGLGGYWLWQGYSVSWPHAVRLVPRLAMWMLIVSAGGYFLGILCWPYGLAKPFENPFRALQEFTNFSFLITYELFEGQKMNMANPPWYYTFKWIGITVPLVVLVGVLPAAFALAKKKEIQQRSLWWLLMFVTIFPVLYTIAKGSTLYSGWRHLMFIYPSMVVLVAAGWEYLLLKPKYLRLASLILFLALAYQPVAWMLRNHPNQYVYFNELTGGINGAYTNYETDYWCNAMRQGVEWMEERPHLVADTLRIATNFEVTSGQYYADQKGLKIKFIWVRENERYKVPWDYAFFGSRTMSQQEIRNTFPPKGTIHCIKADTVPLLAIIKRTDNFLPEAYQAIAKGELIKAMELTQKAIDSNPKNPEALRMAAIIYLAQKNYKEVLSFTAACYQLDPYDYVAFTLMGMAYMELGDYGKAEGVLRRAVAIRINHTSGHHQLGRLYGLTNQWEKAEQSLLTALEYDNNKTADISIQMANVMLSKASNTQANQLQFFQKAEKYLHQALAIDPYSSAAYFRLGYLYDALGNQQKAMQFIEKGKALAEEK